MIRLLNVDTLQLAEFADLNTPDYAILSHRWTQGQELKLDDLKKSPSESTNLFGRKRAGALKLKGACIVTRRHGLQWIWIDSSCIDKSNNSELSEAINSMYSWYKHAKVCLTYLSDVVLSDPDETFENSKWFDRCWTLQELIAPHDVEFYDANWNLLGTKSSLRSRIFDITGIDTKVLDGGDINTIPIGCRMSWVSSRKQSGVVASRVATCVEDEAYSLLGLFDVNIPLLYGEKRKAFKRLQEAILETVNDPSIFAWNSSSMAECHEKLARFRSLDNWDEEKRKLLAGTPGDFQPHVSWLHDDPGVSGFQTPFITVCDKLPGNSAVLKAVFEQFIGLIRNSVTLAMMIRQCTLPEKRIKTVLADKLQALARKLESEPEAQDHRYFSTSKFLHLHAVDLAREAVHCMLDPKYDDRSPPKAFSVCYRIPEAYGGITRQLKTELSFAAPSVFVASSGPYTLFAQELVDTLRSDLHIRFNELLKRKMQGQKNKHSRNNHFLQLIELEFDLPMNTPKVANSHSIPIMDRLRHIYEMAFGTRTSHFQSLQPGEVHISWKSVSYYPLAQICEK